MRETTGRGRGRPASLTRFASLLFLAGVILFFWPDLAGRPPGGGSEYPYPHRVGTPLDLDERIAFVESRVQAAPDRALEKAALASLYLAKARRGGDPSCWTKAEETAQASLAGLPAFNADALLVLAETAQARHDFEGAIARAGEVMRIKPRNPEALAVIVKSLLALGRLEAAAERADALVDRLPSVTSFTLRALVEHARGREREALQDFRAAFRVEEHGEYETSAWSRTMLGRLHLVHGRVGRALALFEEALRILPRYPLALGLRAEAELRAGRIRDAERSAHEAYRASEDPAYLMIEARIHDAGGSTGRAGGARRRAEEILRRRLQEGAFGHRGQLARLLLEGKDESRATEALALAQEETKSRRDPQTLDTLAWALARAGRWEEARAAIREALRSGTRDPALFKRCAWIEDHLENYSRARFYYSLALESDPGDREAASAFDEYADEDGGVDGSTILGWIGGIALAVSGLLLLIGVRRDGGEPGEAGGPDPGPTGTSATTT